MVGSSHAVDRFVHLCVELTRWEGRLLELLNAALALDVKALVSYCRITVTKFTLKIYLTLII